MLFVLINLVFINIDDMFKFVMFFNLVCVVIFFKFFFKVVGIDLYVMLYKLLIVFWLVFVIMYVFDVLFFVIFVNRFFSWIKFLYICLCIDLLIIILELINGVVL